MKPALDTRRKEIKKIYLEPYNRVEAQIKELIAMIDEPLAAIDGFVKDMEAEEKRQKRELIRDWYRHAAALLGELAEKVFDAPGFVDAKWLNKTCRAGAAERPAGEDRRNRRGDRCHPALGVYFKLKELG